MYAYIRHPIIDSFNRVGGFPFGVIEIPPASNLAAKEDGAEAGVVDVVVASFLTLAARFEGVCRYSGTGVRFLCVLGPGRALSSSSIAGSKLSSMILSASSSGLSRPLESGALPVDFLAHKRSILL